VISIATQNNQTTFERSFNPFGFDARWDRDVTDALFSPYEFNADYQFALQIFFSMKIPQSFLAGALSQMPFFVPYR
jgi:hypothetical protein